MLRRKLLTHSISCFLLTAFLPYKLGFGTLIKAIFGEGEVSELKAKLTTVAIGAVLYFVIMPLAKTSAHKWWVIAGESERERILTHPHKKVRLAIECVKIFAIYSLGFYILPGMIMLVATLVFTIALFNNPWIWIGIGLFILFVASFRRARALTARVKFVRSLKKRLTDNGFKLTKSKMAVLSVLFPHKEEEISFEKGGRKYALKLVASIRRGSPMYISPEGIVTARRTVSFLKFEFFHVMTDIRFSFTAEEGVSKILVFSPKPRKLFFNFGRTDQKPDDGSGGFNSYSNYGGSNGTAVGKRYRGPGYVSDIDRGIIKYFENGERVGDYKVFDPDGLFSAISVDCLDR